MTLHIPTPETPQLALDNPPHILGPDDVESLKDLNEQLFPYPNPGNSVDYWVDQAVQHPRNTEVITVAGRVAAYMHVGVHDSETQPGKKWAELIALGVAPEYHRQGVGTYLAARAMQRMSVEHPLMAFRTFVECDTPVMNAAKRLGFEEATPLPVWRKGADGEMHAGFTMDLRLS